MADAIALPTMVPAQATGWSVLLDIAEAFPDGWCLVGGQMVWLLAAEYGVPLPRATTDIDVVVDVRVRPGGFGISAGGSRNAASNSPESTETVSATDTFGNRISAGRTSSSTCSPPTTWVPALT